MGKSPTGFARQKIVVRYSEWLDFDEWLAQKREADRRYSEATAQNIRYAHDQQKQAARHKAFVENAKKHGIPIPKKKALWED